MSKMKNHIKKTRSCSPILASLSIAAMLVLIRFWYLSVQVPDITAYERVVVVGTASLWLGYEVLRFLGVLIVSALLTLWQAVIPEMLVFKRILSIIFFCLGQISILLSFFYPLILVISLFYFSAAWEMNDLIYDFKRSSQRV